MVFWTLLLVYELHPLKYCGRERRSYFLSLARAQPAKWYGWAINQQIGKKWMAQNDIRSMVSTVQYCLRHIYSILLYMPQQGHISHMAFY